MIFCSICRLVFLPDEAEDTPITITLDNTHDKVCFSVKKVQVILRSMASALIRQDWSMVLVEIIIVVVGIFIVLQVDDWSQARRDRIDGQF